MVLLCGFATAGAKGLGWSLQRSVFAKEVSSVLDEGGRKKKVLSGPKGASFNFSVFIVGWCGVEQRSANSYEGPDRKYFGLRGPYSACGNGWALRGGVKVATRKTMNGRGCVPVKQAK